MTTEMALVEPQKTLDEVLREKQAERLELLKRQRQQLLNANPMFDFIMRAKHEEFFRSRKPIRMILGGNKSGKTATCVMEDLAHAIGYRPWLAEDDPDYKINIRVPNVGRIITTTYQRGIKDVVLPELRRWCPPNLWRNYSERESNVYLTTGGKIQLMSNEQEVPSFAGAIIDWLHCDEEPEEPKYNESVARLLTTSMRIWISMTPDPKKPITWTRTKFFESEEDNDIALFSFPMLLNPMIDEAEAERILAQWPEDEREVRRTGCYPESYGLVYSEFKDAPPPYGHVVPPFEINDSHGTTFCGIDPHPNTEWAVVFLTVFKDGTGVYWGEIFRKFIASSGAQAIKAMLAGVHCDYYVIDPLANTHDPIYGSNLGLELKDHGIRPQRTAQREFFDGITRVQQLIHPAPPYGKPQRHVMATCRRLVWELKHYMNGNTADGKPLNHQDYHMLDGVRYLEMERPRWHGERTNDLVTQGAADATRDAVTGY